MRFAYVLPDPVAYRDWADFEGDLRAMRQAGYDFVELQIGDPAEQDMPRLSAALKAAGLPLCAFQTGGTYGTLGNCLSTANDAVRARTVALLTRHVEFAAAFDPAVAGHPVIVFGSLQGARKEEPNRELAEQRIVAAVAEVGALATQRGVTLAFEPVNHGEIGYHNTIAEVSAAVRKLNVPGVRMMVDTFHMNIEERDMIAPLAGVTDLLAHVHLSDTNRDVLGTGHWPTAAFLAELNRLSYRGTVTVGVYNTRLPRRESIDRCMRVLRATGV